MKRIFYIIFAGLAAVIVLAHWHQVSARNEQRHPSNEAMDLLDKMVKGASDYVMTPRVDPDNDYLPMPCRFPESQTITPEKTCCSATGDTDKDKSGKCAENIDIWSTPTWSALKFQIPHDHYYRYEFISSGTGTEAKFEARAYGDLDCDGIESTFIRYGKAVAYRDDLGAKTCFCSYESAAPMLIDKESE